MKIQTVEFIGSYGFPHELYQDLRPEIAFFGRSNVGKSTLINTLLGRRHAARTSKTPGKTRNANFFRINERFFFVDMPGYGYAKVSKEEKERLRKIVEKYLSDRPSSKGVVQVIDIRRDPTPSDIEMSALLGRSDRRICLVFNKVDKVKRSKIEDRIGNYLKEIKIGGGTAVVPFSSVSGTGKRVLWAWIEDTLEL